MTECDVCHAKSQLRLCTRCQAELRDSLTNLARRTATNWQTGESRATEGFLEILEDARYGRTRLGESARRSTERNTPLMVRLGPAKNPPRDTQWVGSPLDTLRAFHATLSTWIRHLCETRGAGFIPVHSVPVGFIGPLPTGWRRLPRGYQATLMDCAEWLAQHVAAIACDEAAGELYRDVRSAVENIEHMVNRPTPPRYCGPCPTALDDGTTCDTALLADRNTTHVTCRHCTTTHDIATIENELWERVDEWLLTPSEIHLVMEYFGEPVPVSTFRRWRASGRLQPRGYRDNKPRYWPKDVRALRNRAS